MGEESSFVVINSYKVRMMGRRRESAPCARDRRAAGAYYGASSASALRRPPPEAALRRLDAERRLVDELRPMKVALVRRAEAARGIDRESAFRKIER